MRINFLAKISFARVLFRSKITIARYSVITISPPSTNQEGDMSRRHHYFNLMPFHHQNHPHLWESSDRGDEKRENGDLHCCNCLQLYYARNKQVENGRRPLLLLQEQATTRKECVGRRNFSQQAITSRRNQANLFGFNFTASVLVRLSTHVTCSTQMTLTSQIPDACQTRTIHFFIHEGIVCAIGRRAPASCIDLHCILKVYPALNGEAVLMLTTERCSWGSWFERILLVWLLPSSYCV